jgi:signal transduction histidine kinase/ligand-binding sensor domain-containing protein/DNA-binding response OmpR family regulator
MIKDKEGNLWIGTWYNGLNKFDPSTEKFTRYLHDENNPSSISSNDIVSLCTDKEGNIWIGTIGGGLNKFDPKQEKFYCYKNNPADPMSLSSNTVYPVFEDQHGILWVGTADAGLNRFDKKKETFVSYKHDPANPESISNNWILTIYEDRSGILWIGTADGGLDKFDQSLNLFIHYSKSSIQSACSNSIWTLYEDSQGIFWVGTDDAGLSIFDRERKEFTCYSQNTSNPDGLSENTIISICEDKSGILWFGTWNTGVNKYCKLDEKKFITLTHDTNNPNSLSGNSIFSIYQDSFGDLWVGTDIDGLNRKSEKNDKFVHYLHNPNNRYSISNNTINSICEDSKGNIWVATDGGGLNRFDRGTNKFFHYRHNPNDPSTICSDRITQVFSDSKDNLWIGAEVGGFDKMPNGSTSVIHYRPDPNNPNAIGPDMIFDFDEDIEGNLWIGTNGSGLSMFNTHTEKFVHYKNDPQNPSSLSHNSVSVVHFDKSGTLWVGTSGGGLNKFDNSNKTFKHYKVKDGLPSNMICGILEDKRGDLWMSTYKGISNFDPNKGSFRNFGIVDGLQGLEFNNWAYLKDKDGRMYFGGTNGLNVFSTENLSQNLTIPPVLITDFELLHKPVSIGYDPLWDRTILEKSISDTKLLELSHDDNIISFEFAALEYQNPSRNIYAYFLKGFDKDWTYTDATKRYVTYTNLDPGEYVFRVKGSNSDGVWNEAGVSLKIIIHSPWWATWWSYMLYGFVFILVFVTLTRIYLYRHRLRTQLAMEHEHAIKLEEVDKLRSNFYANISHEFRTPLMLILGPVEKLASKLTDEESKKQTGLIKGNAKRMLNLINQLLDISSLEANKLKLKAPMGNIAQYVKGIVKEFEQIAEQRDVSLKLIIEKENIEAYFDKEKMERIISNVMSNAIKFTPQGGRITVKLAELSHNEVEINVRDSGIGIPKSQLAKVFDRFYQVNGSQTREHEGTGIGLALTKELVELHRGKILIDSVEGHWTEVRLYFSLGRDHLTDDEISEPSEFELHKFKAAEDFEITESVPEVTEDENLIDKTIVLIVEDNPDVRDYIKDDLKEIYHVEEAANGEQGFRKAQKCIPDLIVSDVMMPKMDGYEMTRKLRQDEKTSHIPIILLTAKSDRDSKLEGLGLGADDYLTKPFDTQELLARIKNLIETRRLLQEKFGAGTVVLHKPEKEKLSYLDQQFLDRVMMVINQHLAEEEFSIEEFGKDVGMSRSQVHRKLKALTGKSTSLYLRTVRLAKAKNMIEEQKGNISEISYQVGFSSPAYFSRCFKEEFGYTPSETSR